MVSATSETRTAVTSTNLDEVLRELRDTVQHAAALSDRAAVLALGSDHAASVPLARALPQASRQLFHWWREFSVALGWLNGTPTPSEQSEEVRHG